MLGHYLHPPALTARLCLLQLETPGATITHKMEIYEQPLKRDVPDDDFVTVVSVGAEKPSFDRTASTPDDCSGYVTVLKIGEQDSAKDVVEEVLVYRLPGERLGFGLKFEGGTKAAEYVKRLFIQSCAPDSPASRVHCSWGTLQVGDEVLEIDAIPVKTMTRIDCVRCLKDSNVVIKLLVKHCASAPKESEVPVPLVVSAEKKRTPPPPPPVPPRKIPRKLIKDAGIVIPPKGFDDGGLNTDTPTPPLPPARITNGDVTINGVRKSPRNSLRSLSKHSPEVYKRDRRSSHGSIGPPDAEVYMDLFSQESVYSLSESDDTGSSISTVVDRLSSYPTTTNSSFSGSLPSTPTAVQRHLGLCNDKEDNVDDFKAVNGHHDHGDEDSLLNGDSGRGTLQPPVSFQDAPLSYGNEDLRAVETSLRREEGEPKRPPPRTKCSAEKNNNSYTVKTLNHTGEGPAAKVKEHNLPRLVDFVPKSSKSAAIKETAELLKTFLENEKRIACDGTAALKSERGEPKEDYDRSCATAVAVPEIWTENDDFYTFNWNPSTHLATIGEDEEEGTQEW